VILDEGSSFVSEKLLLPSLERKEVCQEESYRKGEPYTAGKSKKNLPLIKGMSRIRLSQINTGKDGRKAFVRGRGGLSFSRGEHRLSGDRFSGSS